MCPDCGRQKMLFETEKEANTFLKFNMDAVNPDGTRTMRVYYCPACCGYHISSHGYNGINRTEKLIKSYHDAIGSGEDPDISAYKLCDELSKLDLKTRSEVNRYLRTRTDVSDRVKDKARTCYYQLAKIGKNNK